MNLNKNLVLIGMMASGKSTIGYLISKRLNPLDSNPLVKISIPSPFLNDEYTKFILKILKNSY